jgi:polyisoprenoid-binding protein YceI
MDGRHGTIVRRTAFEQCNHNKANQSRPNGQANLSCADSGHILYVTMRNRDKKVSQSMNSMPSMAFVFLLGIMGTIHGQPQPFQVRARGVQTFNTHDDVGRNQVTFYSKAPLEDIFGAVADVSGKISFDPADLQRTMKGTIAVNAKSMKTGLMKRDRDMVSEQWLDVYRYPTITFKMKSVTQTTPVGANELDCVVLGDFTMHGVTNSISIPVSLKYLEESPETRLRAPGDLLVLRSTFSIRFQDYGINGSRNLIGIRIAKTIDLTVTIVATNHGYPLADE